MLKIIIILILILLFIRYTKLYENPYKLIMIIGKKGSGKSTYFTKLALKYKKKDIKVYSNTDIYSTYKFNTDDIGYKSFITDSVILIDEVSLIWSNRDFKNMDKKVIEWFRYQRQNRNIVYLASQSFDIDKKIRDLCDSMIYISNFMNVFSFAKPIIKKFTINNEKEDNNLGEYYSFTLIGSELTFIPRYAKFFQSFNPPKLPPITATLVKFYNDYLLQQYESNIGWIRGRINELLGKVKFKINKSKNIDYLTYKFILSNL